MEKYIKVYHDVISQEKCQYFIDKFEAYPKMQEVQNNSKGKTLTLTNLMSSPDTPFREDLDFLGKLFMTYVEKYKEDWWKKYDHFIATSEQPPQESEQKDETSSSENEQSSHQQFPR